MEICRWDLLRIKDRPEAESASSDAVNGTSLALRDDALEIHVSTRQRNQTASANSSRSILRMTLLGASPLVEVASE